MAKILLSTLQLPAGPTGPQGPVGPQGDPGLDGANVLPTSEAVAQAVTEPGPAKDALSATIGEATADKLDVQTAAQTFPRIAPAGVTGFPSIVFLGDSNFQIGSTPASRQYGESVPTVTCWQSRGRFVFVENAGVASDTVQMMEARLQADVIDKSPAACVILAGSNSTTKGQTHWDDARNSYENGIIRTLMAAGILPVLCTIPPRDGARTVDGSGTYGANGPLIFRLTLAWNVFVRSMAAKYRLPLVDLYAVVTDPSTGEFRAGWTPDGVHWGTPRSHDIAGAVVEVLTPLFPNVVVPLATSSEASGGNATLNWVPDGLFLGSFNSGTGGRYPSGINGTSSANLTVGPAEPVEGDPLTAGRWMKLAKTVAGTGLNVNLVRSLSQIEARTGIPLAVGQRIGVGFAYKLENLADDAYMTVSFYWRGSGGSTIRSTTPMNQFKQDSSGVVYIEDVVPEGAVDCRMDFGWGAPGTGDFYVGQLTEVNLTGNGIPSLKVASS